MNLGKATVVRGNARDIPLDDNSVDLIVTSPPYFALRSYQDGGEHYEGQIGDEPTPNEFVDSLLEVTAECMRVLKPTGSLWVNLGDKYSRGSRGRNQPDQFRTTDEITYEDEKYVKDTSGENSGIVGKSLMGIPWRYAIRCIDELGLILRAEVIWSKPGGLPESVTDRVRRSHEHWFHFTLSQRYFADIDPIREPHAQPDRKRADVFGGKSADAGVRHAGPTVYTGPTNTKGRLPGSVWTINTEPLRVPDHLGIDHFAAFPTEWPKRIISGWAPTGVCVECGEGRRTSELDPTGYECGCNARIATPTGSGRIEDPSKETGRAGFNRERGDDEGVRWITRWEQRHEADQLRHSPHRAEMEAEAGTAFAHYLRTDNSGARPIPEDLRVAWRERGWLTEAPAFVPPATVPGVVLDPFGGTGTTAMVAKALGRHGISLDMSADYCRLAEWRTNDRNQLAKVLGIAKVETPTDDQMSLFDDGSAA